MQSGADAHGGPPAGTVIAEKYRVESVLGSGGMGCVVKADHLLLKKSVAIKFLQADTNAEARRRLFREARATQALSSENVVRVFDIGVHADAPYIVMELLEGTDLAARVYDEGPQPVEEAVDCLLEACVAVAEAHAVGIVHRDIKPANLFFTRTPTGQLVKVLDFGISKIPEHAGDEDCTKTAEDVVLGTPYYMSPEQLRNPAKIDARADVWALGVTLFFLLSGEHPFQGETPREVTAAIFTDPPRKLEKLRAGIPEALCRVVADALAKRADDRTPSVLALVRALLPFASKRGRLAAERVEAFRPPPPPVTTARMTRTAPLTTTDAGLASTMPPGVAPRAAARPELPGGTVSAEMVSEPPAQPPPRRRIVGIAAVAVALVGAVVWIASGRTPAAETAPQAASTSSATPAPPDPEVPTAAATGETRPVESAAPAVVPSSAPASATPPRAQPARPVGSAARPAASASAAPPAPKPAPRRDIDGVPIVD